MKNQLSDGVVCLGRDDMSDGNVYYIDYTEADYRYNFIRRMPEYIFVRGFI